MNNLKNCLEFLPSGKLVKLSLAGFPNLLHEWDQPVDLDGKLFCPAGWDECFPTIDPYKASPVMGQLIGWHPEIYWQSDSVEQIWRNDQYEVRRRFYLKSPTCLHMSFRVANLQPEPFEFLWASHALFDVQALLAVDCGSNMMLTEFVVDGSVSKQFIANTKPLELIYETLRVHLSTDQSWWGIWLNRGGWPVSNANELRCLGLEATNTPGEVPDGQWLPPHTAFGGYVQLEVYSM